MAKDVSGKSIYAEMLESLPVPERLSPENIAAMLEANANAQRNRNAISVTASQKVKSENTASRANTRTARKVGGSGTVYRTVASLAACAVMAFGLVKYLDVGDAALVDTEVKGSVYAENYDELHKTFRKYYVDDADKMTLDSAMAQIEHSYVDGQDNVISDNVDKPSPAVTDKPDSSPAPVTDSTASDPAVTTPAPDPAEDSPAVGTDPASDEQDEQLPEVRLPEINLDEPKENVIISGNKIYVIDGSTVKVILSGGGVLDYVGDAVPDCGLFETKTLERVFAIGDRLVCVYTVVNEEPVSVPALGDGDRSQVSDLVDALYPGEMDTVRTNSVEVVVYNILPDGDIVTACVTSQHGELSDVVENGGYVYLVTEYSNYRNSPLIGVEDLESYVPGYTVNGEKRYIEPENILIPEYIATTDYAVITAVSVGMPDIPVQCQAVLGTEGKLIATQTAVYLFGYAEEMGETRTVCEYFSLKNGKANFEGSVLVDGVAVTGGIHEDDGVVFVTTISRKESGFVTRVSAMDARMSLISWIDFPGAMKEVSFSGSKVFLTNGSVSHGADFTTVSVPELIEYGDVIDVTAGLACYGDGYVTLTKDENGGLLLAKLSKRADGRLIVDTQTVVFPSEATSKALSDNRILYRDPANGYVGVPYCYFDGYDYCNRFVLYKLTDKGFEQVGQIESHEVEEAFEIETAVLNGGVLYVFSEGRIYAAVLGEGSISVLSSAELIESSYSGHTAW